MLANRLLGVLDGLIKDPLYSSVDLLVIAKAGQAPTDFSPSKRVLTANNVSRGTLDGKECFRFATSTSFIKCGTVSSIAVGVDNITLEAWAYSPAITATYEYLWSHGVEFDVTASMAHIANSMKYYAFGATNGLTTPADQPLDNKLHHFCIMLKGGTMYAYIDGVLQGSVGITSRTSAPVMILGHTSSQLNMPVQYSGYLQAFRKTKALRYNTAGFTPDVIFPEQ